MQKLLSDNYSFLAKTSLLLAVANVALSGGVTYVFWHGAGNVPMWGQKSMVTHLMAISVVASFLFCFLATKATRRALRQKQIRPLHWHFKSQTMIDQLPRQSIKRAFMVSLMGGFLASLLLYLFDLLEIHQLSESEFMILNLIYAALLAAGAAVISVYRAMGDFSTKKERWQLKP